ncbi:hypothetical protein ACFWP0_13135 [Achromobacter sp. NPDC058515]|uniref:hypothetical protein n=1 Tax=Achromobacter sp. NPDC058515 TaxID=3346533 RepID=UPI003660DE18
MSSSLEGFWFDPADASIALERALRRRAEAIDGDKAYTLIEEDGEVEQALAPA